MQAVSAPEHGVVIELPTGYPSAWELDALLVDGRIIHLRPIRPEDGGRLLAFHRRLSPESIHFRYFAAHPELSEAEVTHFATVDYTDRSAFVALVGDEIIGVGRSERLDDRREAEVAFVVRDDFQGRGVGTLLFEVLAGYGRERGIERFVAETLPSNFSMIEVFADIGLGLHRKVDDGVVHVSIDLQPTPAYAARRDQREAAAAAASVASFLRPGSIAVVGAGRKPGGAGHEIVRALLAGEFAGAVYPVNLTAHAVCGVRAYPTVCAIPERVDLVVVAVPPSSVRTVAEDAAAAGAKALVIVTAGFGETSEAGSDAEAELLAIARRHGMRVVGPNCLGVCNTDPGIRCNATFSPIPPVPGRVGLLSQSGAIGVFLLERARRERIGISSFVSVGNKLDVSGNDLLCFWEGDESTDVVALYLESFGNPRKFARIARRVARKKPVVMLKAGRTPAGARAARSHTAAAATPAASVKALLASAGVIEAERLEELLDIVQVLVHVPLPAGQRVGLVGNSGGPLILAADACGPGGLVVGDLGDATAVALRAVLGAAAACANPVDITADGDAEAFEQALCLVLDDPAVDAVVAVVTELNRLSAAEASEVLERAANRSAKPLVGCILRGDDAPLTEVTADSRLALIASPERAVGALACAYRYRAWRDRPEEAPPELVGVDGDRARAIVAAELAVSPGGGWLSADAAAELLAAFGVRVASTVAVASPEEALAEAVRVGFPVVLKAGSGDLVHKSDRGGVALGLDSPERLAEAYATMRERLGDAMGVPVVQPMVPAGVETIVGLSVDPAFGPVLLFGLGGVATDLLGDHALAVPPLSAEDAERLIESTRGAALLHGYRGAPAADLGALQDVVLRVSRLAETVREVVELDLNPVVVSASGAIVVDCKVRVAPRQAGPGPLTRSLRQRRARSTSDDA